jgi:hypothetical protein
MSTEVQSDQPLGEVEKSWRGLLDVSIAKSRKFRGSNYVQISTVDAAGEPRCRTVVFRGFFNNLSSDHQLYNVCCAGQNGDRNTESDDKALPCVMKMCTDSRSRKVEENNHQPIAEMVWWFPKTSEQYRIRGSLVMVGEDEEDKTLIIERKEMWGNMSDPARESFLNPTVPGETYDKKATKDAASNIINGGRDEEGKVVPPPTNFFLMLLDPTEVDYLRLTGRQYRQIDRLNTESKEWSTERVNP